MDIELKDGDISISENGDISFTNSIVQQVQIKLQWVLNEWKWNNDLGIPYFEYLFNADKDADMIALEMALRDKISEVTEVVNIDYIDIDADSKTRELHIEFSLSTNDDETIEGEVSISG